MYSIKIQNDCILGGKFIMSPSFGICGLGSHMCVIITPVRAKIWTLYNSKNRAKPWALYNGKNLSKWWQNF